MHLTAFLMSAFSYPALHFADKFQLDSRAKKPPDKPDLARASVPNLWGHQICLAAEDKKCKAPGAAALSHCAIILQGDCAYKIC